MDFVSTIFIKDTPAVRHFPSDVEMSEEESGFETLSSTGKRERMTSPASTLSGPSSPILAPTAPKQSRVMEGHLEQAMDQFIKDNEECYKQKTAIPDDHIGQFLLDETMEELKELFIAQRYNWRQDQERQTGDISKLLANMKLVTTEVLSNSILKGLHSWRPARPNMDEFRQKINKLVDSQMKLESTMESMERAMETMLSSMSRLLDISGSLERLSHLESWRPAVQTNALSNDLEMAIYRMQEDLKNSELPSIKTDLVEAVANLKLLSDRTTQNDTPAKLEQCIFRLTQMTLKQEPEGDEQIDHRTAASIESSLADLKSAVNNLETSNRESNLTTIMNSVSKVESDLKHSNAMVERFFDLLNKAYPSNAAEAIARRLEEMESVGVDINTNLITMGKHVSGLNHLKATLEGRAAAGLAVHPRQHPGLQAKFAVRPESRDFRMLCSDANTACWWRMSDPTTPTGNARMMNTLTMLWNFIQVE